MEKSEMEKKDEMTGIEENTGEESGFESFASQALRLHRKGSFETLLAQHLAVATPADPMQKVRLVCEAAYMVPPDKLKLDMQQVETIYLVCLSFLNTRIIEDAIIAWGFEETEENYERFITPWHKDIPMSFLYDCISSRKEKIKILQNCKTYAERFFHYTANLYLTSSSFQMLKSEFLIWAVPQAMQIFEQLSRLVDPDLYKEMLGIVKPKAESV